MHAFKHLLSEKGELSRRVTKGSRTVREGDQDYNAVLSPVHHFYKHAVFLHNTNVCRSVRSPDEHICQFISKSSHLCLTYWADTKMISIEIVTLTLISGFLFLYMKHSQARRVYLPIYFKIPPHPSQHVCVTYWGEV